MNLLRQNYVKYGLVMCSVVIICLLLMELSGQNESFDKSPLTLIWTFLAPAIVWFLGINTKKKTLKNQLTFKEGLIEGFKISLVFAILSPFIFTFYFIFINSDILQYIRLAYGLALANDTTVILVDMIVQFISAVIFGTIYAAIISFFLKSK